MAIRQCYSIRDNKAAFFSDCFFCNHDEEAKRQMIQLAGNEKSAVNKFPGDFDLYRVGTFDVPTGRLVSVEVPELVLSGIQAREIAGAQ